MADKILFQRDRLTVAESHLTIGRATVFYSSISAVSIYDGRPLMPAAFIGVVILIPMSFVFFMGARLFGPYFPASTIAIAWLPLVAFVIIGFLYRTKCLFVAIDGQAVAVLKSKDIAVLEQAKARIEEAKQGQQQSHA